MKAAGVLVLSANPIWRLRSWVQQAALAARSCLYLLVAFPYLVMAPDAKSWLPSRTLAASAPLPWTWPMSRAPAWSWPMWWWERTARPSFSSSDLLGIHTLGAMSCMIIPMPSSILLLLPSSCYTCSYWIFKLKKLFLVFKLHRLSQNKNDISFYLFSISHLTGSLLQITL